MSVRITVTHLLLLPMTDWTLSLWSSSILLDLGSGHTWSDFHGYLGVLFPRRPQDVRWSQENNHHGNEVETDQWTQTPLSANSRGIEQTGETTRTPYRHR